jgi:hypothetical protein
MWSLHCECPKSVTDSLVLGFQFTYQYCHTQGISLNEFFTSLCMIWILCSIFMSNTWYDALCCWPKIVPCPVPGCRAEGAAQARSDHRPVPARGTIPFVPSRSSVVLFRTVSVPTHRAWPIWPSIGATAPFRSSFWVCRCCICWSQSEYSQIAIRKCG